MKKLTENALNLLKKGYLRDGENSWEDLARRVSKAIAQAEREEDRKKWEDKFYKVISNMDFVPSTPCLINAGTENQQLSSCFIISVRDDIESIYQAKAEMAKIFQKNGGVGFNISALRPNGADVQTSGGKSCGILGFMEEFNITPDIVTRNNLRKGAVKIDLSDFHPEILEFIKCKDDTSKYNFMNISVALSDKFMECVKFDKDWDLRFPDYKFCKKLYDKEWGGDIYAWEEKGYPVKIYKTIKAKELYHAIMEHAWKTGEPGVSFLDNMNVDNPNPKLGKTNKTNPCFTGDMELLTSKGYRRFDELCDTEFDIVNHVGEIAKGKVWCSGVKDVVEIKFSRNDSIKCTADHVFMLDDDTECKAIDLLGKKIKRFHCGSNYNNKVVDVCVLKEKQKVYDFTEPTTHWGVVNGFIAHNCGEFVSIPYNSCNLGSINLSNMVNNGEVDWHKLTQTIDVAVRFLDNMITVNKLPLDKLNKVTKSIRSIGLGTMGLADLLYQLNISYGDDIAESFLNKLYSFIKKEAQTVSERLAVEKGVYDEWCGSTWESRSIKIRNSNLLSIAPNGSIGFICNTSGGLEPNFALVYSRRTNDGHIYYMVNPVFEEALKKRGLYSDELIQKIVDNNGSCQGVDDIPADMQRVFVIASDISPVQHLNVLATIQRHVDLACSKTINLPNKATVDEIEDIYIMAWDAGVKGVTVYRDGSRENQTLSVKRGEDDKNLSSPYELKRGDILSVSDDLLSCKRTIVNGCGKFYIHVDFDEILGEPLETFIELGSGGGCERNLNFISRLISLLLRAGVPIESIIDQAFSIRPCKAFCDRTAKYKDTSKGTSCPSAIGFALKELNEKIKERCFADEEDSESRMMNELDDEQNKNQAFDSIFKLIETSEPTTKAMCPECGDKLYFEGGCNVCKSCGWSKCN